MKSIFDLIVKQVDLLFEIAKNDDSILLNLFDLVKTTKIPIQLPLTEREIRQVVDNKSNYLKNFLALKFNGIKNTDIVLAGIYCKSYENNLLYIGASGDLSDRALGYNSLETDNEKVKKLDAERIKKKQKLPFLPIIFYSIAFKYKDTKSLEEQSLIEKIFFLEAMFTQAIKKQNVYTLLNYYNIT